MKFRVLIGLPSATGIYPNKVWMNILEQSSNNDIQIKDIVGQQIVKARFNLCEFALKNDFDYIYMQDDDNIVEPGTIQKLIDHGKDIVGVSILQRGQDEFVCVLKAVPYMNDPNMKKYEMRHKSELLGKGLIEVDAIGFGAILIKRNVLEELSKDKINYFQQIVLVKQTENEYGIHQIGEDVSFCINAKKKGFKIWCDASIKTTHFGNPTEHTYGL